MQIFVGSLLLSEKIDTALSVGNFYPIGSNPCNGNGLWSKSIGCICNLGYSKRLDCSMTDAQFANEVNLAAIIISDCNALINIEPSQSKYMPLFHTMLTIANKSDLLNQTMRQAIRNIIEVSINIAKPIQSEYLAKVIDSTALISSGKDGYIDEYKQVRRMINALINIQTLELNILYGNESAIKDMQNFKVQSTMFRGSQNISLNWANLQMPHSSIYLNNTDFYAMLSVIEWKIPIYSWIRDYSRLKVGVTSVDATTVYENMPVFIGNLTEPLNITFPINTLSISGKDLTKTRCMYYDNISNQFITTGIRTIKIDINNSIGYCQAYHLSDFSMGIPSSLPYSGPIPYYIPPEFNENKARKYEIHQSPLLWLTVSLTIVFGYLCFWAFCKEKSENELANMRRSRSYLEQKNNFQENTENVLKSKEESVIKENTNLGKVEETKVEIITQNDPEPTFSLNPIIKVPDLNKEMKIQIKEKEETFDKEAVPEGSKKLTFKRKKKIVKKIKKPKKEEDSILAPEQESRNNNSDNTLEIS